MRSSRDKEPRKPWSTHAVHHASRPPTAWAAMSFHPVEAVTGAVVIPALVFFVPIHIGAVGFHYFAKGQNILKRIF